MLKRNQKSSLGFAGSSSVPSVTPDNDRHFHDLAIWFEISNSTTWSASMSFSFDWKNQKFPMLNVLCWGTGLQIVERLEEVNAETTHQALLRCWLAPFGIHMVLIVDQGREFFGEGFSQRLMGQGIRVHFTDTHSPWQNSRTEKAGGLFKEKLHLVLGETSAMNLHDLDLCIKERQIARNRYFPPPPIGFLTISKRIRSESLTTRKSCFR